MIENESENYFNRMVINHNIKLCPYLITIYNEPVRRSVSKQKSNPHLAALRKVYRIPILE